MAPEDWVFDDRRMRVVFAVVATLIGLGAITTRSTPALDLSLVPAAVVVFWLWAGSERFPRALLYFFGLTVPLVLNIVEADDEVSMFLVVLTTAIVASFESNRRLVIAIVASTLIAMLVLSWTGVLDSFSWQNWTFGILFSWGFGTVVARYAETIEELQHARSIVADQAAVHERRRIARDVHDLVGHSLSVVMLHVTGARHLVRKNPEEAERALEQAEAAGRDSLAEIRRTVGLLRDDSDSAAGALPSPDLTDLAALVDEFKLAGLDVSLDTDGDVGRVEGAAALAGYRIVQEALTNASRHTVGARVTVAVKVGESVYDVLVRNEGGVASDAQAGSGFGLISMRERAKSIGGSLIAGPTPSGWTVEATLPVEPAVAVS